MANWRRSVLRTYGKWKCGDKFLSIVNFENLPFGADVERQGRRLLLGNLRCFSGLRLSFSILFSHFVCNYSGRLRTRL